MKRTPYKQKGAETPNFIRYLAVHDELGILISVTGIYEDDIKSPQFGKVKPETRSLVWSKMSKEVTAKYDAAMTFVSVDEAVQLIKEVMGVERVDGLRMVQIIPDVGELGEEARRASKEQIENHNYSTW